MLAKLLAQSLKRKRYETSSDESGSDAETGNLPKKKKFKEASADNRKLAVVRVSGIRGAPPRRVLKSMDKLFASHTGEDSFASVVKATEGGAFSK